MGKPISSSPSDQTPINNHFSHPHPLHLSDPQTLGHHILSACSACQLDAAASGLVYTCTVACNFVLHQKCYQLPEHIKHPIDQNHALSLQPKPVYPEGLFKCDACGNHGQGFSYNCSPCGVDLHTTCATLPAELAHHSHHHHLRLTFSAPYEGNKFSCDVCKRMGSKTWIYRCNECEFDVHISCAVTVVPTPAPSYTQQPRSTIVGAGYGVHAPGPHQTTVMGQPQNQFVGMPHQTHNNFNGQPVGTVNGGGQVPMGQYIMGAAITGVAGGIAQSTTEALIEGVFGGGGGEGGDVSY